jgi:hypothetical protein
MGRIATANAPSPFPAEQRNVSLGGLLKSGCYQFAPIGRNRNYKRLNATEAAPPLMLLGAIGLSTTRTVHAVCGRRLDAIIVTLFLPSMLCAREIIKLCVGMLRCGVYKPHCVLRAHSMHECRSFQPQLGCKI